MRTLLSALLVLGVGYSAFAQDQSANPPKKRRQSLHDEFTGQGYGDAGCGLGSIIFGPKPGLIQVVSATFNHWTFGTQTFGITSGTSNCDIPHAGGQAAMFIEVNKEIVMKDAARGSGETVDALASILGCRDTRVFGSKLQKGYDNYFNHGKNSYETSRRLLNSIKSDSELKATCTQAS